MAGRVGYDEAAARRFECAVGDVDGDALLSLVLQTVDEEGEVGRVAAGAVASGVLGDPLHFVGKHLAGVLEDAAEQRALSVVHAAAQDESQGR